MEKKIILMVGTAGCGKTTWINEYLKTHAYYQVISADSIRFQMLDYEHTHKDFDATIESQVWAKFYEDLERLLQLSNHIIVDNTNVEFKNRAEIIIRALRYGFQIKFVVFNTRLETVLKQNNKRNRVVPYLVILQQFLNFNSQFPRKFEYDEIEVIF